MTRPHRNSITFSYLNLQMSNIFPLQPYECVRLSCTYVYLSSWTTWHSWQQPCLYTVQWDLKQVTSAQNHLIRTHSDSLVLWLTLWKAPAIQVPGGKAEALWNDAATAGALGQRQMSLRRDSLFSAVQPSRRHENSPSFSASRLPNGCWQPDRKR